MTDQDNNPKRMVTKNKLADDATQAKAQPLIDKILTDNQPPAYPDNSVAAVTDLVKRVRAAELLLDQIRHEWNGLNHDDRMLIDEIAPSLTAVLVRVP